MKKIICFTLLISGFAFAKAQDTKTVFTSNEMVWYGLDFTKAKFVGAFDQIGGAGTATGLEIKNKYIPAWNELVIYEPKNFDLKKTFDKDNVHYDMTFVNELNSKIDADAIMTQNPGKIEKSEIEEMVKKYNGEKKDGLGLSFIVENFNKTTQMADIYVVFFDIATKKVLLNEKMSGKAVGIGMRNYWAGAIKSILKDIDRREYKNWKKNNAKEMVLKK